jgi:hypothetical protein
MTMNWILLHPQATLEMLGFLPSFLDEEDPRSAREQFNTNYISGWNPTPGFKMQANGDLSYSKDLPTKLLMEARFRDETIRFYQHAWVAVIQPDGSYEISRMD